MICHMATACSAFGVRVFSPVLRHLTQQREYTKACHLPTGTGDWTSKQAFHHFGKVPKHRV